MRQTGVREELFGGQITRLAPFENGLSDVRGEIAEADDPSEIGSAHPFMQSKRGKGDAVALHQGRLEPARPEHRLIPVPLKLVNCHAARAASNLKAKLITGDIIVRIQNSLGGQET